MATIKQKKALVNLVENGGNVSKAMLDAGYSPNTAKTPSKLTESVGFIQYLESAGVTDEKIARVLNEGLGATKTVVMGIESKESFVDVQPDYQTRHKYLETAIKVKGHAKEVPGGTINNFGQMIVGQRDKYGIK